jgi:hypothetical protein
MKLFPRLQLAEIEDQPWYPRLFRDAQTDFLRWVTGAFRVFDPAFPLLLGAYRASGQRRWVDLCSGGGGALLRLGRACEAEGLPFRALSTDLYPNAAAQEWLGRRSGGRIEARAEPVDALALPGDLDGFLTAFNAFHHFAPDAAARLLGQAVARGLPIAILEPNTRHALQLLAHTATLPLLQLLAAPFLRPFRWKALAFTWLLPIIPACTLWDAWVSVARTYSPGELLELARQADPEGRFRWESGRVRHGFGQVQYLLGMPAGRQGVE